jgi:hypothetical protein
MRGTRKSGVLIALGLLSAAARAQTGLPAPGDGLTIDEVLSLAQNNEPTFAAALAESRAANLERKDAETGLLRST